MHEEFNDLELPQLPPMTDREKAELLYEYLKLFLPACIEEQESPATSQQRSQARSHLDR